MEPSTYRNAANKYIPEKLRILFIGESPPHFESGELPRYFYFDTLTGKEYLFRNTLQVIAPSQLSVALRTRSKATALSAFQELGCFLIDACEEPVNHLPPKERIDRIRAELDSLTARVDCLAGKDTPIVLLKRRTLQTVQERLLTLGYQLVPREPLPFPAYGNQVEFRSQLRKTLSGLNIID